MAIRSSWRGGESRRAALAAGGVLVALMGLTRFWDSVVDSVVFQPSPGVDVTPAQLGIEASEVYLETDDGVRIHAFVLPSPGATRAILFLHGNAGNASHRLPNADALRSLGAHVLLLDYRGYGRSEGRASEAGVYADARAGLAYVNQAIGIPESRVVVFGRSLGGAVAVHLARQRSFAGLILESTFTSIADLASGLFGRPLAWAVNGRFDAAAKIASLTSPVLFFHGDRDTIVPIDHGRRLFAVAPEPKAFETLEGAGHNDTVEVGGRAYFARIGRFLDEVAP